MINCLFFVLVEVKSLSTVYSSDDHGVWIISSWKRWNFTNPFLSFHLRFGCKCFEHGIELLIVLFVCRKYFPIYNYDNQKIHYANNKPVENWQLLAYMVTLFVVVCYIFVYTLYQTAWQKYNVNRLMSKFWPHKNLSTRKLRIIAQFFFQVMICTYIKTKAMPEEHFGMQRPNPNYDPSSETGRFIST